MSDRVWLFIAVAIGALSVGVALRRYFWVKKQNPGSEEAQAIAGWIREGARTYLRHLYTALGLLVAVLGLVIAIMFSFQYTDGGGVTADPRYGTMMALAFISGAFCSATAGYLGMTVAVTANARTSYAAGQGVNKAFRLAFNAGSVMGLAVIGLAIIGMSVIYLLTGEPEVVLGFSFGSSTLALLTKASGGIYTKTADIAADLVGKIEVGIPEDDPRNPAVVADNVGDNVGDVAGMGADIFDSYVASTVAVMVLGLSLNVGVQERYIAFPLILCALGTIASLIGSQFVRVGERGAPGAALNRGTLITCALLITMVVALVLLGGYNIGVMWAVLAGLIAGMVIGFTSNYYTSKEYRPLQETARVAGAGAALNIIVGFSYGLISVVPSIISIVAASLIAYYATDAWGRDVLGQAAGIYGVGVAAVGMLSISGMIVSADAYGPIVDNARGIAEMAGMDRSVIDTADVLDAAGNTAKAITKGFAISAAALTVLALFAAYSEVVERRGYPISISLLKPEVIAGVLLGAMTPPLFSALTMLSVTKNAFRMIEEIRDQFRKKPGILAGTDRPDYARCVGLAAQGALLSLVLPTFLAIMFPLVVGFILGPDALGGFLGGSIFTGVVFALFMVNTGGLWDNAKKYIEAGRYGGPGSESHKSSVVGDTVGDPFKDTAGPSLNTLIMVTSLVSSLFAPIIAALHLPK